MVGSVLHAARLLFFVLGILLTVCIGHLFKGCNETATLQERLPSPVSCADLPWQRDTLLAYRRQVVGLNIRNAELEKQITDAKKIIVGSASANTYLKQTLRRHISQSGELSDTVRLLQNCDSLAISATQLMISCIERDSMYHSLANAFTEQIELKDSIIKVENKEYEILMGAYDRTITDNKVLRTENLALHNETRKHKSRNKFLSAGILFIGATITYMALHR